MYVAAGIKRSAAITEKDGKEIFFDCTSASEAVPGTCRYLGTKLSQILKGKRQPTQPRA